MTTATKPTRQEYESITFRTTPQRPSRKEYETTPVEPVAPKPSKPSTPSVTGIYGAFDVWAAPSDSEIWKSPGADFVRGFGQGWMRQTQVPALMGKKLPPPTTRAERIGEGAGQAMEVITEFIGLGALLRGIGMMSKVIPKGAWAGRALQTGFLFGTQQATEEARKATAEAVYGEDFGSRGGIAILESFALGAILSIASSGVGKVWNRLKPSEQTMLLRELGLKKGATLREIDKAAKQVAAKSHFDFGREGMNPAQIRAIENKFKQSWQRMTYIRDRLKILRSGDIIKASSKQNFKKQLMGKTGVSSEVADVAIKRLDAGESITKVDQMISQAKVGIKPLITAPPKDIVIPPTKVIAAPEKPVVGRKAKIAPTARRTKLLTEGEVHSIMSESLDKNEYTMYLQDELQARTTGDQEAATRAFDREAEIMFERGYLYNEKQNQWARVSAEFKAEVEAKPVEIAPVTQPKAVEVETILDAIEKKANARPYKPDLLEKSAQAIKAGLAKRKAGKISLTTKGRQQLDMWRQEQEAERLTEGKSFDEGQEDLYQRIERGETVTQADIDKYHLTGKIVEKAKIAKPITPEKAVEVPEGLVEKVRASFNKYQKAMPNATEQEIVEALIEDDIRPPEDMLKKYEDLPSVQRILEQDEIDKVIKRTAQKEIIEKPTEKIPPRPLVNPKASALQQDKQLKRQQVWDKKYGKIVKPKGKPGFIDVRPLLKVHKTFMGIVEPSKAVELKLGKEPYAAVIKGVHEVDVGRIEFNEAQIEGQDKSLSQMSQWFSKFSDKDLKNFMISRGTPRSEEAQRIQYEARGKLPKELQRGDLFQAAQRIADSNYKYLQSVVGDDVHRVEDYFYGIWKNPKKVDKLLDYWHTTKRFTKEKKLPTVADAMDYDSTMELRSWNPIENLKAEYIAISHLEGMNWMKNELLRIGKGKYIDSIEDAPMDWEKVQDPVFKDLRLQPDLAKLINNLIATNKISRIPILNTLREINNVARTIKFVGSAFHLLSVAKQSVADSGYLGFLYKPTALRGFTRGFRANDPIFKTTAYKDYIRHGGGHRYSVESEARRTFNRAVNELNKNMGIAVKVGALPLKIPVSFVNWMFQSYIPKVKYAKFLDVMAEKEKKFNRKLTSPEKIDIIKEQQNFYGMMNERLFGRSGTVTSALRFYFMSPGYAEGNYRTMLKAATQWGGKSGVSANRSRSNIINSWLITGIAATVGTLAFTGKPPRKPESLDDARDLFKIDTGKVDEKGRRIMIDMMTYDKDYWNVAFNILRLRPDVALGESWRRIGGMKAPTAEMIVDLALMSMGKAIYDWKGDRVVEITDPFLLKAMKLTAFEIKKLSPISVSVFQQSKKRDIDTTIAAIETLLGFRPTKTEKDIREQKITSKMYSLAGQREEMSYYIGQSTDPKKTVARYNKTVNDILNSPYVPKAMKDEWGKRLLVDYDKVVTWKRFPAGKMTNAELSRAYDAHTLSVPYKRRGEPFRMIGEPKKGSEKRVEQLKAEAKKRGIVLKRGPRKPPRR